MHVHGKDAAEDPEASRLHASEVSKPTAEDSEVKLADEDSEVSKPTAEDSEVKLADEDSEVSKPTAEDSEVKLADEDSEVSKPTDEDSEVSKPTAEDSEVKLADEDSEVSKPTAKDSEVSKPTAEDSEVKLADEDSEVSKPTDEVSENDWEKLVCAMFTGAELSDGNLAQEIRGILGKYVIPGAFLYLPKVTALYQENHQGVIVGRVLVSDVVREHVEQQFLKQNTEHLRSVHNIGISYSPCTARCAKAIVERYKEEALPKPVIHFSWVHNYPYKTPDGRDGIEHLIENGFKLQVWETNKMYSYLLQQAPTSVLKEELQQAYENTTVALSKRDMETQKLIEEAQKKVNDFGEAAWGSRREKV